jgi:hypothetical protein
MIMKTVLLVILIALALSYAQAQTKDDTIKSIEQKCLSIKQDSSFKIMILIDEEFLDSMFLKQAGNGYGQLKGYFRNEMIYRIQEKYGIKLLKDSAEVDYYFQNGQLIYVYEKENYFPDYYSDSTGTLDYEISGSDFEGYYYFVNEQIIFTNTFGKQQILPNEMFFDSQSKQGQLLLSAHTYTDLLTKKLKK